MPHTRDVCLATAVTDSFVPGAVVMLGSFRACHPGFEGDYFVLEAPDIRARTGLDAARAKALHFKGSVKPWTTDAMLRWARGDDVPAHRPAGAPFRRWYDAYVDVLARAHLRAARPALAKESVAPAAPPETPSGKSIAPAGRRR